MKEFGKKILTAVVALLLLAAPVAIVWGITSQMNNKESNVISMTEARALVNKVYTALVDNGSSLSTASVESYDSDYVVLDDTTRNMCLQPLLMAKLIIEESDAKEGCLHSSVTESDKKDENGNPLITEWYTAYKLVDNGIVVDMIGGSYYTDDDKSLTNRMYLYLFYHNDNSGNYWYYELSYLDVNQEVENYDHGDDTKNFTRMVVGGINRRVTYLEKSNITVDQTFYGNDLTNNNVVSAFMGRKDANKHEVYAYSTYAGTSENWGGEYNIFEESDLNDYVLYLQDYVKNAYSPKFYEIDCTESNWLSTFTETYKSL